MTSRNQLIAQQRNDFRPRQLRCSLSARLSASRSEVHIDEELTLKFKTLRHRRDEPYKTKDIQHQRPLLGVQHRQDERARTPRPSELWRSAPGTSAHHGKRRVVCQPNFGWQLWKRNGYICVYFNWPPGPNPVVAISTRVGPGSRLCWHSHFCLSHRCRDTDCVTCAIYSRSLYATSQRHDLWQWCNRKAIEALAGRRPPARWCCLRKLIFVRLPLLP